MSQEAAGALPLVSVVIPCYNGSRYLREAVDSALAQSYPAVEVIVVDDGSTDDSWEVIRSYGERVHGIRQENRGLPGARNAGIARARGDYFLFLDADDLIDPDTVESLVAVVRGRGELIAACPWRNLVLEGEEWVRVEREVPFPQTRPDPLAAWLEGEWIPGCSLLWPRSLLARMGGYDESLTADEDGDLMYRSLLGGAKLVIASGGESLYRRHGTAAVSMSHDVFSEHRYRSRLAVFEKLEAGLRAQGRFEEYRASLGLAYQALAQRLYGARPDLAREALERGEALAGRRAVSPTLPGRVLVKLLGMEGKERVVQVLARLGVMTPGRRALLEHRKLHDRQEPEVEARP